MSGFEQSVDLDPNRPGGPPRLPRSAMYALRGAWRQNGPLVEMVAERFLTLLERERPGLLVIFPRADRVVLRRHVLSKARMIVNAVDRLRLIRVALEVLAQDAYRRGLDETDLFELRSLWIRALDSPGTVETWAWEEATFRVASTMAATMARMRDTPPG